MGNSFGSGGNRHKGRRFVSRGPRKNERIRVPEIRVIGPDGSQIGVMKTHEALTLAKNAGLDLVEISPTARPPVCRILDFGKYMYEQGKKAKENKTSSNANKLKEVKFRVRIDQHDFITKLRHAEDFLDKGFKVKMTLMFRGREMEHKELGFDIIKKAVKELEHIGTEDMVAKLVGRNITVTMSPLPSQKKKLKFNVDESEEA